MRLMEGVTMADDSVNRQSVTKLFLSGLPPDVEQETVVELLLEHDIVASEVDVKSGGTVYLDCADQSTADRAIDKLNGFKFQGSSLLVEPATNGTAMSDSGQESARRVLACDSYLLGGRVSAGGATGHVLLAGGRGRERTYRSDVEEQDSESARLAVANDLRSLWSGSTFFCQHGRGCGPELESTLNWRKAGSDGVRVRSCVLQISGLSSDLDLENFRNKLDTFGEVASVDRVEDGLLVTYGDEEQANRARSGLNGTSLEEHPSSIMTVEYVNSEEQPLAVAGDSSPATPETDGATPAIAQAESTTPSIPDEVANSEPKMNGDASLATDDDPDKLSASSPNPQGGQTSSGSASPSPTSGGAASQTSNQKKPSSRSGGGSKGNRFSGGGGSQGGNSGSQMGASSALRPSDFPLRMLVSGEMVGAIIGRQFVGGRCGSPPVRSSSPAQGTTIRQITQQTRARVDVHRKDNTGTHDKAITIYGNPENCTAACKKILEVMQEESRSMGRMVDGVDPSGEIPLRLLAHNNLIGRIIGKGGATIKKVMQDTDTKITVSSINELSPFNLERVITIKGSLEAVASAEALISTKLRQSYESDLQAMAPQAVMFPGGIHPMMMATLPGAVQGGPGGGPIRGGGHPSAGIYSQAAGLPGGPHFASAAGGFGPGGLAGPPGAPNQGVLSPVNQVQETAYLSIPNNSVGAVIGTKGSYIRNIIRVSGASVKIAPPQEGVEGSEAPPQGPYAERKVTIIGGPEAQWKSKMSLVIGIRRRPSYIHFRFRGSSSSLSSRRRVPFRPVKISGKSEATPVVKHGLKRSLKKTYVRRQAISKKNGAGTHRQPPARYPLKVRSSENRPTAGFVTAKGFRNKDALKADLLSWALQPFVSRTSLGLSPSVGLFRGSRNMFLFFWWTLVLMLTSVTPPRSLEGGVTNSSKKNCSDPSLYVLQNLELITGEVNLSDSAFSTAGPPIVCARRSFLLSRSREDDESCASVGGEARSLMRTTLSWIKQSKSGFGNDKRSWWTRVLGSLSMTAWWSRYLEGHEEHFLTPKVLLYLFIQGRKCVPGQVQRFFTNCVRGHASEFAHGFSFLASPLYLRADRGEVSEQIIQRKDVVVIDDVQNISVSVARSFAEAVDDPRRPKPRLWILTARVAVPCFQKEILRLVESHIPSRTEAQGMIYEKLREEIFNSQTGRIPVEDPRLSVEIPVPSSQVGRIIGKGGSNVRELQRATGAVIKLPEQGVTPSAGNNDTLVHISGPFYSVQSAQRRIRTMVAPPQNLSGGGPPGGPLANPHVHVFAPQMQGSFAPHPQHQGPTAGGPHHPQSAQPHPSNLRMGPRGNGLQQPTPVHMNHAQPKPGGPYVVSHAAHNAM
ncbi:unnamed protein product [Cyprideis torosa]|uniref:Uncharacterized protein n=1 Tax=Cyprideis torosa TaxID=163714 RepID=A0A7R8WCW5_9CRUS|nr:unnamed protein product [Cyprideis torosa]CAG0893888.1 unnamed protein product [Cyprideis torosa]